MAKNAATEQVLGDLHAKVSKVFDRILTGYMIEMDREIALNEEGDPMPTPEPNPAILGAVTKFLKDNSIAFDTEEIAALSDVEQRLAQRRKQRANLVNLTNLKVVEDG
jgi:hypothetical protein